MKTSDEIRKDFPIFENNNIAYLDSAATSQKPKCVLNCVDEFYKTQNANPHRGTYNLGVIATERLNSARETVSKFINSKEVCEIIFTKNATEALNLVAYSYGLENLNQDDEIVLSIMEHHSMIVPWQKVAKQKNAKLKFLYLNDNYEISDDEIEQKITNKTKGVGISTVSNVSFSFIQHFILS